MAGHSKWATTKRRKSAVDAKRANIFTKLARNITVAAREKGPDIDTNFSLRLAVEKAKAANMPKDNIERAIKRGTGELEGEQIEEILYEGYGPDGIAIMVSTVTDNRNRTVSELKHAFSKNGGNLGNANSVQWMFDQKGMITLHSDLITEEFELELIEHGVDDIQKEDGEAILLTEPQDFGKAKGFLEEKLIAYDTAELTYLPKEPVNASPEVEKKIESLVEKIEELSDTDEVYTNLA